MKILQCFLTMFLISANVDDKTTRQGFFAKIRDSYLQGRYSREEKRIVQRKADEKLRRRLVLERNIKTMVDGISSRIKARPRQFTVLLAGGVVLVVWLCHKGSIGCHRHEEE